jgi:hypothetical protein
MMLEDASMACNRGTVNVLDEHPRDRGHVIQHGADGDSKDGTSLIDLSDSLETVYFVCVLKSCTSMHENDIDTSFGNNPLVDPQAKHGFFPGR